MRKEGRGPSNLPGIEPGTSLFFGAVAQPTAAPLVSYATSNNLNLNIEQKFFRVTQKVLVSKHLSFGARSYWARMHK
jgi:hypothetical protein